MANENILELSYKTPQKPLRFSDVALCWMCGKKALPALIFFRGPINGTFGYCSEQCKTQHEDIKSQWKP